MQITILSCIVSLPNTICFLKQNQLRTTALVQQCEILYRPNSQQMGLAIQFVFNSLQCIYFSKGQLDCKSPTLHAFSEFPSDVNKLVCEEMNHPFNQSNQLISFTVKYNECHLSHTRKPPRYACDLFCLGCIYCRWEGRTLRV